jgi:hypothetical protein
MMASVHCPAERPSRYAASVLTACLCSTIVTGIVRSTSLGCHACHTDCIKMNDRPEIVGPQLWFLDLQIIELVGSDVARLTATQCEKR